MSNIADYLMPNPFYKYILNIYKDGCCRSKERIRIYFKIRRSMKRFVFFEFIYFVLTYVLYICMFPACYFHQRTFVAQSLVNGRLELTLGFYGISIIVSYLMPNLFFTYILKVYI